MDVKILAVPYDAGVRGVGMGLGPERVLREGLLARLAAKGHRVEVETVEIAVEGVSLEVPEAFALGRLVAERVRAALAAGSRPVVLAGNCNTAVGTIAGIGPEGTGVVWFDSHGDLNTPETTASGFFDGMALAVVTGRCWSTLAAGIPGFAAIPDRRVILAGARDLDAAEGRLLESSGIRAVPARSLGSGDGALERALSELAAGVRRVYVHIDLDVLDSGVARANRFAAPGGPTVADMTGALRTLAARLPVGAIALTAYDPAFDADGSAAAAAVTLVETAVDAAARSVP